MSSPIPAETQPDGSAVLRVRTLGSRVAADRAASVIARFERSAYVQGPHGEIACIGGEGLGLGPLNALAAVADFERLALAIGDRVALDARTATVWRPRGLAATGAALVTGGGALATLADTAGRVAPRGLADTTSGDPVTTKARRALATLTTWIATGDGGRPPDGTTALLGLGPGLTPAGDDALGGALIALRAFGRGDLADRLAALVLPLAAERTSTISLAHLDAAAGGEGAEALHDTLAALAGGDGAAAVAALQRLDRIGHSSGWDALAGATAALEGLR